MQVVQLLGPVELRLDGRPLHLRGPKQRALLAMLALDDAVVSRDRLIDGLWGPHPPSGAEHALDAQVSSLRRALAAGGGPVIERRAPGYRIDLERDAVDVSRFDHLVARGRRLSSAGDPSNASAVLTAALDLWHGSALSDVQGAPFAAAAADDLERRRVDALEERVDADLARGLGPELVAELEGLVREHPFRERLIAALALASYRSGQQARALETIASARRTFAAELGVQPGASLLALESRILRQDPALKPRRREPVLVTAESVGERDGGPRLSRWLTVAVVALVVGGGLAIRDLSQDDHDSSALAAGGSVTPLRTAALSSVSASSGGSRPLVELSSTPSAVVAGQEGVWVAESSANKVLLVEPTNGSILAELPIPGGPGALTIGDGAVFVAGTQAGSVVRIDEESRQVTQTIPVGGVPSALAYADHRLWVADQNGRRVLALGPATGKILGSVSLPDRPTALAADESGVWVASHDSQTVRAIDPDSAAVLSTVQVGGGPSALALGGGSVWVANNDDSTVSRLDPGTARVAATFPVNSGPAALTFSDGSLWVAGEHAGTLARIDPSSGVITRQIPTRGNPVALAESGGDIWVGTSASADAQGGTMRLLATFPPSTVDPGFGVQFQPPTMLGLVHDGLVTFDHTSGPQGLQLVPDLAISIPPPSTAATIFRFRLRTGIRYSNGAPVRASDFRRAFRRLFVAGSPGAAYFGGIVGAPRCISEPGSCTLRRGVVVDDALGTVTFHLKSPDPDFPFRLAAVDYAAPVPRGTPLHDMRMSPIPGTGPYRIVSADAHEIRLERNPMFHEWSYAAQPAGNPDAIVWRFGQRQRAQVDAVRRGDADWTFQGIPARMETGVRNHDAARLHVNDEPETDFLMFRASAPPFDDVRVRRALNLAIDRGRIAEAYGGPEAATPTCQMLPPGVTAHIPFCPFTRDPRPDGTWSAPDLARARRLVARSRTRGDRITVLGVSDDPHPSLVASRAAARALTRLGYQVRLRVMSHSDYNELPAAKQASLQVFPFNWYADFPSPATFFQTLLPCRPQPVRNARQDERNILRSGACEQVLNGRIQEALQREAQGRSDQVALWSAIDRRATRQAFTVPLVNPRSVDLTSKRLSGYEYNPLWGFLPAQAVIGN